MNDGWLVMALVNRSDRPFIGNAPQLDPSTVSPFAETLAPYAATLPPVLRTKFLGADLTHEVAVEGEMDTVWRKYRWLWLFFWISSWMDLFFPETGNKVPASLVITAGLDGRGQPCQVWKRTFRFSNRRVRRFNALVTCDHERRCVLESAGPFGVFEVEWAVGFPSAELMEIRTAAVRAKLGRWSFVLPRWLSVDVCVDERVISDDRVHVELTVSLPFLRNVFGYRGTFSVGKRPAGPRIFNGNPQ